MRVRRAAIDVGTNTVRLLVADLTEGGLVAVERRLRITRLGQGVDRSRRLDPAAVARTVACVAEFAAAARAAGAQRVRLAGTSALRDAEDREAFARAVREATGLELEVLDGLEEGRLAYLGATSWLAGGPFVVCDIGGGSTELVAGAQRAVSVDVGSVRLRERCFRSDPPAPEQVEEARAAIRRALAAADARLGLSGGETVVGVAGTITTLAALILGLDRYEPERVHGARLAAAEVAGWSERLVRMSCEEIRRLGPVEEGRADVIGAGSLILAEVLGRWGFGDLVVSERDILDGLVADMR